MPELSRLKRYPLRPNDPLQAWDAADELLIQHLEQTPFAYQTRTLIINDTFGALSASLAASHPTVYSDSYGSTQAIAANTSNQIQTIHELKKIAELSSLNGLFDQAIVRIPKNLSFFEDILCTLSQNLKPGAPVICGYMIKYQSKTSFELLGKIIGQTKTSLARKKARLIFANLTQKASQSPYPISVTVDEFATPLTNHSNLFSREKLDIGTRFFLEHIPQGDFSKILDLGCGNGIIGIAAGLKNPDSQVIFSDDSYMAVLSTHENYRRTFGKEPEVLWNHCHEKSEANSLDLVLCNPPFHQGGAVGDFIAWQMFKDAHHALKPGGRLRIIGNAHLQYHLRLREIFGNSEIIAQNRKFVIVDSFKR